MTESEAFLNCSKFIELIECRCFSHAHCSQVHKTKHKWVIQSPQMNTGSRARHPEELSGFKYVAVMRQDATFTTFLVKFLPWSTVSAIIVKWKHLWAATSQPRSSGLHNLTERAAECWSAAYQWKISYLLLNHSRQSSKLPLEPTSEQTSCIRSFMKWVFMAE